MVTNHQEELMLTRRQKTLSSIISNYIPLHIILNRPTGVSFSITVPKSLTIEQLARQIEAEYAFLVERELGTSRYPVIECGALFDHVELPPRQRRRRWTTTIENGGGGDGKDGMNEEKDGDGQWVDEDEIEGGDLTDEREEAESRGVQLRFSDRVEDVLEWNSTVHAMNIDQGLGMGRKLSLTNLALAVGQDAIPTQEYSSPSLSAMSHPSSSPDSTTTPSNSHSNVHISPLNAHSSESDLLSIHSSVLATMASTPIRSRSSSPVSNGLIAGANSHLNSTASDQTTPRTSTPAAGAASSRAHEYSSDPRASTVTTDTTATLLASSLVSSTSSILNGSYQADSPDTVEVPAQQAHFLIETPSRADSCRPTSMYSTTTDTTAATGSRYSGEKKYSDAPIRPSARRQRSRATDILLNLESSSNDARFQEILHNSIALDHFRQFCFQEYSIENLLFWMDVELFAKPSKEFLKMGRRSKPMDQSDEKDEDEKEQDDLGADKTQEMSAEQFGVQHARYIYLTYIDSCGPLQVNLSDESRTDIPWPILDYESPNVLSMPSSVAPSPRPIEKKKGGYRWGSLSKDSRKEERRQGEDDVVGWPLDRHMFDGAQEHTYQLMKGHTLVRFEESDLWKATEKIKREQPDEYAKATFQGPFNSHYRPNKSVILSTVARSRSRHPSARPLTLYNWNNSTSDLDRSRDKEEALAETMSQYFGPIPTSIRHPSRVILGLGRADDFGDDEFEDSDDFENCAPNGRNLSNIRASANSVAARAAGGTRRHLFSKRLNDNIVGRKGNSNLSEDMMDLYADDHYRSSQDTVEIESIENGKRTTRWMVAGYFSDHVRLTAAQRKRLLRRNNKLTKFFGSRVDGTLCPVEEITENGVSRVALAGPSSAPTMGSPLAYALSSSTIHDMDKKHMSKLRGNGKSIKIKRNMMGSGSEVLLLSPGEGVTNKPKSSNLLQKFRRSSPELEDERGYMAFQSLASSRHPFDARRSPTSSRGSIFKKTGEKDGPGHFRSKTATDLQHHERRILAHPHPLWSGSLSDQEGVSSSAYERRRGMSILSIMGNSNLGGYSGGGVAPTTPTSAMIGLHAWHKVGADQAGGASLDRQAMYSRRKKADKLSTFFGAQLTTLELSSQLPMGQEDSMVGFSQQQHRKAKIDRMSSDSNQQQSKRIGGVTVSSVNQLSDRERTALWKRNKKLRGLLGESLPETQVAAALTRPVLFSSRFKGIGAQGRRTSAGNRVVRRRRQSSVTSKAGSRHGAEDEDTASDDGQSEDDEEEEEGDEDMDALLDASSGASRTSKGKGKIPKRSGVRSRRLSTVSASPRKGYQSRPSRVHRSSLTRLTSHQSLRSFLSIDSLVTAGALQDDDDYDQDFATGIPPSPGIKKGSIRPFSQTDLSANAHVVGCVAGNNRSPKKVGMSRYHRKKKMDKIHQFLGDRVPEQDLWMGTVGRERTQEMLDLNLLSPTSSVGSGSPSLSSLERHGFHAGRSSCGSTGKGKTADLRAAVTGSAAAFGSAPARVTTGGKDESAKMERLLSDPRGLGMGRGKSEGLAEDLKQLQGQSVKQCFTTTGRLRQQLASPIPPPLSTSKGESMSGIGQLLHADANVNANNNNSADAGCISSSSATSGPALPLSPLTTTTTAENDLTSFTLVQDSRYDNDSGDDIAAAQILPRLRAMSGKDQERFLRRAEKLERYFGQFPPSVFLENSLKSKSSCTGDSRVASAGSEGRKKEEKGQRLKKDQLSKRSLSEEVEDMVESLGVTDTKF